MPTLPETIAAERDECCRLAMEFDRLGSAGAFAAALIQDSIARADAAVRRGEHGAMLGMLEELRGSAALRCRRPPRPADRPWAAPQGPASVSARAS